MTARTLVTTSVPRAVVSLTLALGLVVAPLSGAAAAPPGGHRLGTATADEPLPNYSTAAAINDAGLVVGSATSEDGPYTRHPVMWRPTSMGDYRIVDLGTMADYDFGGASSVNDSGQVVGSFGDLDDGLAFLRQPGSGEMVELGTLGGGGAIATDINDKGQVVGWSTTATGAKRPFLWHPRTGAMDNLGTLGSRTLSMAVAINDKGVVLGMAWTPRSHGTAWHAWLWRPDADHLVRLERHGLIDGTRPEDLNDKGQAVGCTYRDDSPSTAVLYRSRSQTSERITSLGGDACAWALNDDTVVTGWSTTLKGQTRSIVWEPGQAHMKSLGITAEPSSGTGVNDDGLIVGSFGTSTAAHAFLWRPKNGHVIDLGLLVSNCRATNVTGGHSTSNDLQAVLDAAAPGDTIEVAGVCQGKYTVATSLTLVGTSAPGFPRATLDGQGMTGVVRVSGDGAVELRDLVVTNGWSEQGAGIDVDGATLRLAGTTAVAGNTAPPVRELYYDSSGGGISVRGGRLELTDTVTVSGNWAESGGGIWAYDSDVALTGSASVDDNGADSGGGVRAYRGTVTLAESASVTSNTGGGIHKTWGLVALSDQALVAHNTEASIGGGIYDCGRITLEGDAAVIANRATLGGGIYVGCDADGWGRLVVRGSATVSDNVATKGGGIYSRTDVTLSDTSTVTLNTARRNGGGLFNDGGTVAVIDSASITDNVPNDCVYCS